MNIFVLHRNPAVAASMHCDTHVVKMILETAQLLSSALHYHKEVFCSEALEKETGSTTRWFRRSLAQMQGERSYLFEEEIAPLYSPTHENHPCAVWVREARGNYVWTWQLLKALISEYQKRYGNRQGKTHKTARLLAGLERPPFKLLRQNLDAESPTPAMTPFPLVVSEGILARYTDPVEAYRAYYREEKAGIAEWKFTDRPEWMDTE